MGCAWWYACDELMRQGQAIGRGVQYDGGMQCDELMSRARCWIGSAV